MSENGLLRRTRPDRHALDLVEQVAGVARHEENPPYLEFLTRRYAQLGDGEEALRRLSAGYEHHTFMLPFVNVVPAYDVLRSDPRFADLVRRAGLPQP